MSCPPDLRRTMDRSPFARSTAAEKSRLLVISRAGGKLGPSRGGPWRHVQLYRHESFAQCIPSFSIRS